MTYVDTAAGERTISAFFDNPDDAEEAIDRLASAGIPRSAIRLVPGQEGGATTTSVGGGSEGGFWDALKDIFMPDEDRYTYAEGLRRGGYLVTVTADATFYETALDILDDEGTVDIGEREQAWRTEGWSGYSGGSGLGTGADYSEQRRASAGNEEVIPVVEEQLRVGKRDVSHGRVRVRSYIVETPVSEQVNLREENVRVERRPVDRPLSGDESLFQDRTIEVEERAEEAVVAKDARIREELVISKDVEERTETISDAVRHTEVEVEDDRGRSVASKRRAAR